MAEPEPASPVSSMVARSVDEFDEAVSESFVPLKVSGGKSGFRGLIRGAGVDGVHITDLRASAHSVERTPDLIAEQDSSYYKVSMLLSGSGILVQDNREALLRPGDFAVYDTGRPYSLEFDASFRTVVLMYPKYLMNVPMMDQITAVLISGQRGPGGIVSPFLAQLAMNLEQVDGSTGARLTSSAVELMGTVFTHELGLADEAMHPHKVLMQRILAHIDKNLALPKLGPASIAATHFISTRHLHALFQEYQDMTVSAWIRSRRLERCRRDLVDPVLANRPLAAIAARWGFVDPAHFSRVFKATYGVSPREFRSAH